MLTIKGAGIYCDSGTNPSNVSEYHFNQLSPDIFFDSPVIYTQESVDNFINSKHLVKFAAYHVSFPIADSWVKRFDSVYDNVNHSFVFCSELHQNTVDQLNYVDRPNTTFYISGSLNFATKYAQVNTWMDWFITTSYFYKHSFPNLLDQKLNYFGTKSRSFDVLLGCQRYHRDYVHHYIVNNQLDQTVLMTYHRRWNQDLRLSDQYITEDEGVEYLSPAMHTIQTVKYYGISITMSQIVPFKIYNQTYYSLVAETNAVNSFNFYTEKIVKPILAKRLFIVIAGQNYLKNLRAFGFKTFDGIIDESYDYEINDHIRWQMALDQLQYLCKQNPQEVLNKIKDVVEYNQQLMLNTTWYENFRQQLAKDIVRIVDR